MIYIEHDSMDPCFWFGLENDLLQDGTLADDVFLFWHTQPTLMLGRYQNAAVEINREYANQRGIHIVRRLSGGGTIYTDPGSWQFSFIKRKHSRQIDFEEFITPVLDALRRMGLDVSMSGRNDLLIAGKKFSGNAQHHTKERILHHGSILFDTDIEEMVRCLTVDDEKFISKGIRSVRQRVANLKEHIQEDMDTLAFRDRLLPLLLPNGVKRQTLDSSHIQRIQNTYAPMFKSWDWVFGRAPAFQVVNSKQLPGGKVEVGLNLKNGIIVDCSIRGDFFFAGDINTITQRLVGCRYDRASIYAALFDVMGEDPFYQIKLDELMTCIL